MSKILQGQFETIENYNSTFKKVRIKIFAFGKNQNFSNITPQAFEYAKDSIYNIPIVAKYNEDTVDDYGLEGDLEGHNTKLKKDKNGDWVLYQDTVPLGLVPESAEIYFEEVNEGTEEDSDIKTYVVVDGCFLWMRYDASKKIEEWLNNGITPKVSMEINPLSGKIVDNYYQIDSFEFEAIAALGSDKTPCFPKAEIENYSKKSFKEMYLEMLKELKETTKQSIGGEFMKKEDIGSDDKIEIDNSKDSANTSGAWSSVNKTNLRNSLMKASNYKSLTKEAYLIRDEGWEDAPSSGLHYPHHVIQDGKLVVHQKGCQAALSRLEQNDPNNTTAKSHLKRHYRELGMDLSNFEKGGNNVDEKLKLFEQYSLLKEDVIKEIKEKIEEFSLEELKEKLDFALSSQMKTELRNALRTEEKMQDNWGYEHSRYWYVDHDEYKSVVYAKDAKDNYNIYKFNYSMDGDNVIIDFESGVKQKITFADWQEGSMEFSFVPTGRFEQIAEKFAEQKSEFEKTKKELANQKKSFEELQTKYSTLEDEVKELKQYQIENEQVKREQAEQELFEQYEKILDEEIIKQFKEKAKDYSIEELDKELKLAWAENNLKFTAKKKEKSDITVTFEKREKSGKPYADIISKYKKD